jgi:hypothetical protein
MEALGDPRRGREEGSEMMNVDTRSRVRALLSKVGAIRGEVELVLRFDEKSSSAAKELSETLYFLSNAIERLSNIVRSEEPEGPPK